MASSPAPQSSESSAESTASGAGTSVSPLGISLIIALCSALLLGAMGWQVGSWQEHSRTVAALTQARALADAVGRVDTATEAGETLLQSRIVGLKQAPLSVQEALVLEGTRFVAHTTPDLAGTRLNREDLAHKALYDDSRSLQESLERNREERKTYPDLTKNPFQTSQVKSEAEKVAVGAPVVVGEEMRSLVVIQTEPGRFPAAPFAMQLSIAAAVMMAVAFALGRMGNRALVALVGVGWLAVAGFLVSRQVAESTQRMQDQVGKAAATSFVAWKTVGAPAPAAPVEAAPAPADGSAAPVDGAAAPAPADGAAAPADGSAAPAPAEVAPSAPPSPEDFLTAINQDGNGNPVAWVSKVGEGADVPAGATASDGVWAAPGEALEVDAVWAWRCFGFSALLMLIYLGLLVTGRTQKIAGGFTEYWYAYAYIAPAVLGTALLVFGPFLFGIMLGFYTRVYNTYEFVGLQNFGQILSDFSFSQTKNFYRTLAVTILWTVTNVSLHVSIGLGLALMLKDKSLRFTPLYRTLLVIPWALPNYITALIWKGMFNKEYGAVNAFLSAMGVDAVSWFNSFWGAFFANLVTNVWLGFPFMMVISLGALQSIPNELYEAADVDGAGAWDKFVRITLPLLKPALFPAVILGSIWTFNQFNVIYLVSGGAPDGETDILITEAYRWAFEGRQQYGYAAAYSTIIFVILFGYTLVTNKITKSTDGAYT